MFWVWLLLISVFLVLNGGALNAQSIQYGKLTGTILDDGGQPIPGVQVELMSEALITGKRLTTTSESGSYVFLNLPVGTYRVSASAPSFSTMVRDNVNVSADTVATIDFTMQLGEVEESVTVTAEGEVVDIKNSAVNTTFNDEFLDRIPTARDAFYDLALTAPGMFDTGRDSSWLPSPTAYGSGTDENAFLVNGVNATSPRGGGFGSLVNVNYDTVEEVRIVALGPKAEYGSATGVAVDVVTKSGSNNYHGEANVYSQLGKPSDNSPDLNDDLHENWLTLDPTTKLAGRTERDREFSFTVGGPIARDKVWFFGGVNFLGEDTKEPLWPVLVENNDKYYDFKVSAAPTENHQAWISYHFERNDNQGATWGNAVPWDSSLQYGANTQNDTISTEWQWIPSSKSIISAKYLGFWTSADPFIPDNAPANSGYINWWKFKEFGVNGHFPYIESNNAERHTIQADMSRYVEDFLGQQDIKFGVQYTTGSGNDLGGYFGGYANFAYPYRYTQVVQYAADWYGDTGMLWFVDETHTPPFETVRKFRQTGFFFDDQWSVNSRLTLNLGLRFDNMTNKYGTGKVFVQPDTIHFDIGDLDVARDRQGTENVYDFNNWSPRIGAAYSLTEDGKTVIRGNFGRYYAPVGLENLRRLGPDLPLRDIQRLMYNIPWDVVDVDHDGFIDPEEVTNTARLLRNYDPISSEWRTSDASWEAQVNPDTKNQYQDQFVLGFERELMPDLSFGVTYIHKSTKNILVNIPVNRSTGDSFEYERQPYTTNNGVDVNLYGIVLKDYNGDGTITGDDVQWVYDNVDYEVRNLEEMDGIDPKRTYDGLQFVVQKRFSNRAQLLGSFLYSASDGVAHRGDFPFQDINIQGPMIIDTTFFGSLNNSINNLEGPLPFTPKYEFKLSGSYVVPKIDADLGMRLRFQSGRPILFLEDFPIIASWNFSDPPPGAVISPGTPIIVGQDPNDPNYLPSSTILDLRFAKYFNLGNRQTIEVSLDAFNIFNTGVATNADYYSAPGVVTAVTSPSRKFRLGLGYQF
jgi:hypothetical protein